MEPKAEVEPSPAELWHDVCRKSRRSSMPADISAAVDRALERAKRDFAQRDRAERRLDEVERRCGPERALLVARNQEGLSGPGLVMDLIDRAVRDRSGNPEISRRWAEAAIQKAEPLGSPGLSARAWAEKGNAERILEEFTAARASFEVAIRILANDGGGVLSFRGDVLSLLGSLEHALRRPVEALGCLNEALWCFRELGMERDEREVLIKRANVQTYRGAFSEAIKDLKAVTRAVQQEETGHSWDQLIASRHNTLWVLVEVSLSAPLEADRQLALEGALQELERLTDLLRKCSVPASWETRHLWLLGRLLLARGRLGDAERALDRAVVEFLELDLPATAAVVSLDLALVLARKRELGELRAVAGAACMVLEAAGLKPDAWAALRMLLDCDLATAEAVIIEGLQRSGGASLRRTPGMDSSR